MGFITEGIKRFEDGQGYWYDYIQLDGEDLAKVESKRYKGKGYKKKFDFNITRTAMDLLKKALKGWGKVNPDDLEVGDPPPFLPEYIKDIDSTTRDALAGLIRGDVDEDLDEEEEKNSE